MTRLKTLNPDQVSGKKKDLFNAVTSAGITAEEIGEVCRPCCFEHPHELLQFNDSHGSGFSFGRELSTIGGVTSLR